MILATLLAAAAFAHPAGTALSVDTAHAAKSPICHGAPGRPSLCRPATDADALAAARPAEETRVAAFACHPDPSKNRGCFRREAVADQSALAANAPLREDAR
ncbi:hypothetical protein [Novosphingobium sp.]|uniref:hypothetical protein n=1 Tax=Novosphingobium sp. TaxID=1874826 RepID=UPI002FDDB7D9